MPILDLRPSSVFQTLQHAMADTVTVTVAHGVQGPLSKSQGVGDPANTDEQQLVPVQSLLFDDHFGDAYSRVQRVRAKKVSSWMEKKNCLPVLISASLVLSPMERLMPGSQFVFDSGMGLGLSQFES